MVGPGQVPSLPIDKDGTDSRIMKYYAPSQIWGNCSLFVGSKCFQYFWLTLSLNIFFIALFKKYTVYMVHLRLQTGLINYVMRRS